MLRAEPIARAPQTVPGPAEEFAHAVIDGLSRQQKTLPCHYFYDAEGSDLFERITRLPEYYPTRTEAAILAANAIEIASSVPAGCVLVEFGSGSSLKTELILNRLARGVAYVPIDVSSSALAAATRRLKFRFPGIDVRPVVGDFTRAIDIPRDLASRPMTGFFPGSTIGNLTPADAVSLLATFRSALGTRGRLIVGVDLKKDVRDLVAAYNDSDGITAAFNLNILARINRELGGRIDLSTFRHEAIYRLREGRIEMHLVSRIEQDLWIAGRRFRFKSGETIHTENSYKYSIEQFRGLAKLAGWKPRRIWTDPKDWFSVHELGVA